MKDNLCESHSGPNLSPRNLYCIGRSCKLAWEGLFIEGALNGFLCESRVTQV